MWIALMVVTPYHTERYHWSQLKGEVELVVMVELIQLVQAVVLHSLHPPPLSVLTLTKVENERKKPLECDPHPTSLRIPSSETR